MTDDPLREEIDSIEVKYTNLEALSAYAPTDPGMIELLNKMIDGDGGTGQTQIEEMTGDTHDATIAATLDMAVSGIRAGLKSQVIEDGSPLANLYALIPDAKMILAMNSLQEVGHLVRLGESTAGLLEWLAVLWPRLQERGNLGIDGPQS